MKLSKLFLLIMLLSSIQFTVTACDTAENRAKKIVSLRSERKQMFDQLYHAYGGSELSQSIKSGLQNGKGTQSSAENQITQGLANFAQGADRSLFEQNLRTVGSGENLIVITDKAKQFFARTDVIKKSKKICEIDIEVEQLERKEN